MVNLRPNPLSIAYFLWKMRNIPIEDEIYRYFCRFPVFSIELRNFKRFSGIRETKVKSGYATVVN